MVDQRRGYIPDIHVTICHSFDGRVRVGSPAFPRIINMECLPLAYGKSFTTPTALTGESTARVSRVWPSYCSQCGGDMMQHAFVNGLNQSASSSDAVKTPHCRANCFHRDRLNCTAIIVFSRSYTGHPWHMCSEVSLYQMMQKVRCCCGAIRPRVGLASCTEPHQPSQ